VNRLRLYVTAEHLPLRVKRGDAQQIKNVPEAHAIGEAELLVRQHVRRLNDMFHVGASQLQTMQAGTGNAIRSGVVPGADTVCRVSPGVVDWHHRDAQSVDLFLSRRRKDQGRETYRRKLYCTRVCRIFAATQH
jgi:hypothetical protein